MSVHPSLSAKGKGKKKRSVLKRYERVKDMEEKEKRKPGDSVFGLPKLKTISYKLKKIKKEAPEEKAAGTEDATAKPATPKDDAKK